MMIDREDLDRDLDNTLYEIVIGGHVCLIGKSGYIDFMCGDIQTCEIDMSGVVMLKDILKDGE